MSPRSWGQGPGDESPDKFVCTEPPLLALLVMNVQPLLERNSKFLLPGFTHHPNAAWPSLSSLLMPAEPAAGLATVGTMGHLCLSSGHGCCPDLRPAPGILPPGTLCFLPSPLLSPATFWVTACPQLPVSRLGIGLGRAQYSFGHPFEYM